MNGRQAREQTDTVSPCSPVLLPGAWGTPAGSWDHSGDAARGVGPEGAQEEVRLIHLLGESGRLPGGGDIRPRLEG